MKSKIIIIASLLFSLIAGSASADARMNVTVNGKAVLFDEDPVVQNGVTLVQFKPVFNDLGIGIGWNQAKKQVTGSKNGTSIILNVGSKTAYVNGSPVLLQVAPKVINGSVFVPLRFVGESTGSTINVSGKVIQITNSDSSSSATSPSPLPAQTAPSSQSKKFTLAGLDQYLNDHYSVYYFNDLELELSFTSDISKSGQYSLSIDLNDPDDTLDIFDMLQNDHSLISNFTSKFAEIVHEKYGENDITIYTRSVMFSRAYPSNLSKDAIIVPSEYEGYKIINFIFASSFDYINKEYISFIISSKTGDLITLDSGGL